MALGGDAENGVYYGYRYCPANTSSVVSFFKAKPLYLGDSMFTITSAGRVFWGGDPFYASYGQTLIYTRLYLDYTPVSENEMLNLALMPQVDGIRSIIFSFSLQLTFLLLRRFSYCILNPE